MADLEVSLADAAHDLGKTWAQTWALVLTGVLRGQKRGARWYVLAADVDALRREVTAGGRAPANPQEPVGT
ncbi:MAG: hypothetical protein O2973_12710 [Gemmatimonadetes bacterium]|nr:hypothetical protein [Gemmatimonadota bacterium]